MNYRMDAARQQIQGAGTAMKEVSDWGGGSVLGAGANMYPSPPDAQRKPELGSQVDRMGGLLAHLDASLEQLAQRLDGVLRPPEPAPAPGQHSVSATCPMSGYANLLYQHSAGISQMAERVQDLLRRLEV